jgi:hypothetical protein
LCVLCFASSNVQTGLEGIHTANKVFACLPPGLSLLTKFYQYKEAWKVYSKVFFQCHITSAVKKGLTSTKLVEVNTQNVSSFDFDAGRCEYSDACCLEFVL